MAEDRTTWQHKPREPGGTADGPVIQDARDRRISLASIGNILVGAWLVVAPIVLGYEFPTGSATWNAVVVGSVVLTLAPVRAAAPRWVIPISWLHVALGVWLLVSPFLLGYSDLGTALVNDLVCGAVLLALAAYSALAGRAQRGDEGSAAA